ncbi:MAG TPA: PKD domain-containing protein, partial [Flavobacteriales bacterium]|nr:PKD domain-containing protein [Flavobacteriales bacterium]
MRSTLRTLVSSLGLALGLAASAQYTVTVSGHVSPCALLDNTVTVRVLNSPLWNGVQVPVDGNCDYTIDLDLPNPTGEVIVVAGCSNGLVPNNTQPYAINTGNSTSLTMDISCQPDPCHACIQPIQQQTDGGGNPIPFSIVAMHCSTGGTAPISMTWTVSDGTTVLNDVLLHTFTTAGTYTVCFTFSTGDGCSDETCQDVVIDADGNIVPPSTGDCTACLEVGPALNGDGQAIPWGINVTNCSSGGVAPFTYVIDYGDGNTGTAGGAYIYDGAPAGGFYFVCITMTDATGCTSTICRDVIFGDDGTFGGNTPEPCHACIQPIQQQLDNNGNPIPYSIFAM